MKEILKNALKEIKPSKDEEKEILARINSILRKIKVKDARTILGGSGAKGTWLRKANDADLFVLFNYNKYKDKSDKLSDLLENALKKKFRLARLHGSRDYFQIRQKYFTFEVIPILDIQNAKQARNITDVSPLHAKWVKAKSNEKMRDEIRLVKQFCKSSNIYGAESYIRGFSGYICEVLTIYYGGFLNLARNAAKWKEKAVVDAEKHYKRKDVFDEMNKSKLYSPLILVDPVQADRNAAAALSYENFFKFKKRCEEFLKRPSIDFFRIKKFSVDDLRKMHKSKKIVAADVEAKKGKADVVGAKLVKAFDYIKEKLAGNEFKVIDSGWDWDKGKMALLWFVVDREELSKEKVHPGPPLKVSFHADKFRKKYKKTFIKGGRICANVKREFRRAEDLIKSMAKDSYLKEKIKSLRTR